MTRSPSSTQGTFDDDGEKDARGRRKERPQQLDLIDFSEKTSLVVNDKTRPAVVLSASNSTDSENPRSPSASSSLDPYYFTIPSYNGSPFLQPPSANSPMSDFASLPPSEPPYTPARDPASIDRNGLVGVGELHTPRWPKSSPYAFNAPGKEDEGATFPPDDAPDDGRDTPWTIEAVDGEEGEEPQNNAAPSTQQSQLAPGLHARPSIADESGGEEILYPRKPWHVEDGLEPFTSDLRPNPPYIRADSPVPAVPTSLARSGSLVSPARKARKRTSGEISTDFSDSIPSSLSRSNTTGSARKHRSLVGSATSLTTSPLIKARDRRRGGSVRLGSGNVKAIIDNDHVDYPTTPSTTNHDSVSREHVTDVVDRGNVQSPSMSGKGGSAIARDAISASPSIANIHQARERELHSSPSVAHSLLRGMQEGWSGLDDDATAEALRKLDGIQGKSSRARSSIRLPSSSSNYSRPSSPGGAVKSAVKEEVRSTPDKFHRISEVRTGGTPPIRFAKEGHKMESNGLLAGDPHAVSEQSADVSPKRVSLDGLSDDLRSSLHDNDVKKPSNLRSSFTYKRGSVSSTNYTTTPTSSRDSTSLSTNTNATSVSNTSRFSLNRTRRNSAGSDVSSVHSSDVASQKDRAASLVAGEGVDERLVPPVPPLPKDLSTYRSPPQSSTALVFPGSSETSATDHKIISEEGDKTVSYEPHAELVVKPSSTEIIIDEAKQSLPLAPPSASARTPSKKWSFTNALSLKRSGSPSSSRTEPSLLKYGQSSSKRRSASSKDSPVISTISPKSSTEAWSPVRQSGMTSKSSLASLSSLGSAPDSSPPMSPEETSPRNIRSVEQNLLELNAGSIDAQFLSSPGTTSHRDLASKRLTPSSIPFFRRSSSQSMQVPPSTATHVVSTSPTFATKTPSKHQVGLTPSKDISANAASLSTPGGSHRKSSMLSLGLPSILKSSSSRKSLQAEKGAGSGRESDRPKPRDESMKSKVKKDDKDRSESRISVLMGRRRGKTVSETDPKKVKPMDLPPIQIGALPQVTADRIAQARSNPPSSSSSSSPSAPSAHPSVSNRSSRATSQTISSMQKQSDLSLRSSRQQLPTIAGSPSVGTHGKEISQGSMTSTHTAREPKDHSAQAHLGTMASSLPKETPTRIPRIASRSSAATSPVHGVSTNQNTSRRTSMIVSSTANASDFQPAVEDSVNEFGVLSEVPTSKHSTFRQSVRASPTVGGSRTLRQGSSTMSSSGLGASAKKLHHDSVLTKGLRKSSTGSVSSMASTALNDLQQSAGASPSKGLNKLLSPKMSLPSSRFSTSSSTPSIHLPSESPSLRRQSLSTPSPVSNGEDDITLGDEEMLQCIRRQQARKIANGAKKEDLEDMLRFPEPLPPAPGMIPLSILESHRAQHLSDYERKEILDYPMVYYIGNKNEKKMAVRDNSTNNYGYDDDRGDYQVIPHDHLAYRYEIHDTLGKGSFGQVLHCRDHCTGESVAIKIIRNKKRFHHQALVEIKILENLRKWDPDEKHHVIKMTEHFYFRNHLCIAMELLSINLYELIKANGFAGFSTTLIRRFTSQMLASLSLMRHHRIVHCDLKPENILLRHPAKSAIKVIDFGSSCLEHEKVYTYIQSRFYRSPEVILGMNYNMAIDMWSLGCILAELYTGYPIFPGENEQEQLSCIMEVLGVPEKEIINRSSRKRLFFDSSGLPRAVVNSKGRRRRPGTKTLAQVLRCDDELFVDFVAKCLHWDPERRIKPASALRHPFLTAGRRPTKVPSSIPSSSRSQLSSSSSLMGVVRNKSAVTETPKKSLISAPTPLTARSARAPSAQMPSTPIGTVPHPTSTASTKSYRTSHASFHSSRAMNGISASAK
ncbi:hypothetical protein SCHPADRAFT_854481 [Schizopora paradoxa]|uniref:dual-specificity kinase n=1 Tax=Schizopora paradoxa TaxID=27342 RepID=A0A0H2RJ38_9AGAM|nr:hypothetical protein SCHPADRAFT_854481 [Schizopora paradoxa]